MSSLVRIFLNFFRIFVSMFLICHQIVPLGLSRATGQAHGYECSAEELKTIAKADVTRHSNCPKRDWLILYLKKINSTSVTIVDVGCNKGDDFVSTMEAFSNNPKFNVTKYKEELPVHKRFACGASTHIFKRFESPPRQIRGYCIEPMNANVKLLTDTFGKLGWGPEMGVHIVHCAVEAFSGHVKFPDGKAGDEQLAITNTKKEKLVDVQVINLDEFFAKESVHVVDFLSIDTEGHDARVILGMLRTLGGYTHGDTPRIRVFQFEHTRGGPWSVIDLKYVIDMLDEFGYDCFWTGNHGQLWRVTGCWLQQHAERKKWSNIMCIHRAEASWLEVNELSKKFM